MFCSLSGVVPQTPVVSKKTGHLFERSLIESHLENTGVCPITAQALSKDDLISVNTMVQSGMAPPRTIPSASIPGLLRSMQTEWEVIMLEQYSLRTTLEATQRELIEYKHKQEAACRVIARLQSERDEARSALEHQAVTPSTQHNNLSSGDVNTKFEEAIIKAEKEVVAQRKTRSVCKKDRLYLDALALVSDVGVHASGDCEEHLLIPTKPGELGSMTEQEVTLYDMQSQNIRGTIKLDVTNSLSGSRAKKMSKSAKVTCVDYNHTSDRYIVGADDGILRIFNGSSLSFEGTFSNVGCGSLTSIVSHASTEYVFSGRSDGVIEILNVATNRGVSSEMAPGPVHSLVLHPDGNTLGVVSGSCLIGLDTRASLRDLLWTVMVDDHDALTCARYSQNGYHLVLGSRNGKVEVYDLRRSPSMDPMETYCCSEGVVTVGLDCSGTLLAAAGSSSVHLLCMKPFEHVRAISLSPSSGIASAVCWSDSSSISCSALQPPSLFVATRSGWLQEYRAR